MVLSENDGIKELKQLVDGTCKILGVDQVSQITDRLAKVVIGGEIEIYQAFKDMVGGDLPADKKPVGLRQGGVACLTFR